MSYVFKTCMLILKVKTELSQKQKITKQNMDALRYLDIPSFKTVTQPFVSNSKLLQHAKIHKWVKEVKHYTCENLPSFPVRALFNHSVRWRTKSKKKSPSGTLMTLSLILTKSENPSALRRPKRSAMLAQKSFERVLESTSKACRKTEIRVNIDNH